MTDKKLLELAAKAAEIDGKWSRWHQTYGDCWVEGFDIGGPILWNPLTDDGDAFRLAMKLNMDVETHGSEVWAVAPDNISNYQLIEWHKDDKCAAARKAIVRVASQIGQRL